MGVFEKDRCLLHKSDHKYVCRGKSGGRQLNKDKCSGSNIQSMGSDIRRNQEKLHQEKVSNILTEHFAELDIHELESLLHVEDMGCAMFKQLGTMA